MVWLAYIYFLVHHVLLTVKIRDFDCSDPPAAWKEPFRRVADRGLFNLDTRQFLRCKSISVLLLSLILLFFALSYFFFFFILLLIGGKRSTMMLRRDSR